MNDILYINISMGLGLGTKVDKKLRRQIALWDLEAPWPKSFVYEYLPVTNNRNHDRISAFASRRVVMGPPRRKQKRKRPPQDMSSSATVEIITVVRDGSRLKKK